jgi:Na+-translocating ferredoxin:NAD+ oxidoreductase RnfC subunit
MQKSPAKPISIINNAKINPDSSDVLAAQVQQKQIKQLGQRLKEQELREKIDRRYEYVNRCEQEIVNNNKLKKLQYFDQLKEQIKEQQAFRNKQEKMSDRERLLNRHKYNYSVGGRNSNDESLSVSSII